MMYLASMVVDSGRKQWTVVRYWVFPDHLRPKPPALEPGERPVRLDYSGLWSKSGVTTVKLRQ